MILDELVRKGKIKSYEIHELDEEGVVGHKSECRNTERLKLVFDDETVLVIDCFCSGSLQNVSFFFSQESWNSPLRQEE